MDFDILNYIMHMSRQWMHGNRRTAKVITGLHYFIGVAEANNLNGFMCFPCGVYLNKND
jgi:uncharacterized Fe-S cluster-containing radical SAM superfamily protein